MSPSTGKHNCKSSKRKRRQSWNSEDMEKAVRDVRNKRLGFLKAAKVYNVPKTTLFRLAKMGEGSSKPTKARMGRKTLLPPALEAQLVEYLLEMEKKFFGLTRRDVKVMAYQLARANGLNWQGNSGIAGPKWLELFLIRHKDKLSVRKPTATSHNRAKGFTKEKVQHFFKILQDEMDKKNFPPARIFNVDETGLTVVQSKVPSVLALKGKRQVAAISSVERGSLVTAVTCMGASGIFVPPMLIFPRKNWTARLMTGAPAGCIGACHPSGWIQSYLFTDWFKHFIKHTRPSEESPVLLILDGHYSHSRNLDVLNLARENHVSIVCIPPHTSHKLQPLDKTFMGALKDYYSEEIRLWLRTVRSEEASFRHLNSYAIAQLFGKAYIKVQTASIAISGFRATGIYPFNPAIFNDSEYLHEELLDEDCNEAADAITRSGDNRDLQETEGDSLDFDHPIQIDTQAEVYTHQRSTSYANGTTTEWDKPSTSHASGTKAWENISTRDVSETKTPWDISPPCSQNQEDNGH